MLININAVHKRIGVYYLSYVDHPLALMEVHLYNKYPGNKAYSFYGYLMNMSLSQAFTRLNDERDITLKVPRSFSIGDILEVNGNKYMCVNNGWIEVS